MPLAEDQDMIQAVACTKASASRKLRNRNVRVHVFSASVSVMCLAPNLIEAAAGERSAIDLPEHDVERAEDPRDIGQHVPPA